MALEKEIEDLFLKKERIDEINDLIEEIYNHYLDVVRASEQKVLDLNPGIPLAKALWADRKAFLIMEEVFPGKAWDFLRKAFLIYWPTGFWMDNLFKLAEGNSPAEFKRVTSEEIMEFIQECVKEIKISGSNRSSV